MDKHNLIDFNNSCENNFQILSPCKPDPFDLVFDKAFKYKGDNNENKENINNGVVTPNSKRNNILQKKPLFLEKPSDQIPSLKRKDHKHLLTGSLKSPNLDISASSTDSLQCLSDSIQDVSNLNESFSTASKILLTLPEITIPITPLEIIQDSTIDSSLLNKAFVNTVNSSTLSSKSSYTNLSLFNRTSVDISNIRSSASSTTSTKQYDFLNVAFIKNDITNLNDGSSYVIKRGCSSARKPTKMERALNYLASMPDIPKKKINNSFSGFDAIDRMKLQNSNLESELTVETTNKDDSVFLETIRTANVSLKLSTFEDSSSEEEYDLSHCTPPWSENEADLSIDEQENIESDAENVCRNNASNEMPESIALSKGDKIDRKTLGENLLQTLTLALRFNDNKNGSNTNSNDEIIDPKQLGQNLLNALAMALNIENLNTEVIEESKDDLENSSMTEVLDLRVSKNSLEKEEVVEALDLSMSSNHFKTSKKEDIKSPNNVKTIPKIQISKNAIALPVINSEKKLKTKCEKDKNNVNNKGPLKAVIPIKNMTKNRKSIGPKNNEIGSSAPDFRNKKTSTPIDSKMKAPVAQSTPDLRKPQEVNDKKSVRSKLNYSLSPLARRNSLHDTSDLHKPISKSIQSTLLRHNSFSNTKDKKDSNIPMISSMSRRRSAGDLKEIGNLKKSADSSTNLEKKPFDFKHSLSLKSNMTLKNIRSKSYQIKN